MASFGGMSRDGVRANAKQFHLTYAACYPGELDFGQLKQRIEEFATPHGGLHEWSIGREKHTNPADPQRDEHFHLYLHFNKRKDVANRFTSKVFDIVTGQSNSRHPEIQAVGGSALDREMVVRYTMKDGDFECSDGLQYEFRRRKGTPESPQKAESWADQLNREPTVQSGMAMLNSHHPEIYFTKGTTVQTMLKQKIGQQQTKLYFLSDFNRSPTSSAACEKRAASSPPCTEFSFALRPAGGPRRAMPMHGRIARKGTRKRGARSGCHRMNDLSRMDGLPRVQHAISRPSLALELAQPQGPRAFGAGATFDVA